MADLSEMETRRAARSDASSSSSGSDAGLTVGSDGAATAATGPNLDKALAMEMMNEFIVSILDDG